MQHGYTKEGITLENHENARCYAREEIGPRRETGGGEKHDASNRRSRKFYRHGIEAFAHGRREDLTRSASC